MRAALLAATAWLERQAGAVNALNVFPVPDGDTGTNMALTMRAAVRDLSEPTAAGAGAGEVADRAEYGALMGARGNSGVILSQLLRGFARSLRGQATFDGQQLAAAFEAAANMAYQAVLKPVEGTMLTVARETAAAASAAAREHNDVRHVLMAALAGARASLQRTPELLDLLRQAGVVDAGGQGLVVLLEGMVMHLDGALEDEMAAAPALPALPDLAAVHAHHPDDYGYCTNFMLSGDKLPFEEIRAHLAAMGHSAVIVGDERLVKVHLHCLHPGAALEYALQYGALSQIKIDNMDEQRAEFARQQASALPSAPAAEAHPHTTAPVAVLAVASGAGFERLLGSLGVSRVVAGGQTMNPSAEDLLRAIETVPQRQVILLPNNGNIVMAARQAAELTDKEAVVVPTKSLPQGIAALLAFSPDRDLEANAAAMRAAGEGVQTGEVTKAVRSVELYGVRVQAGQTIALLDDCVVAASADADDALLALLQAMQAGEAELITLYYGHGIDQATLDRVRHLLADHYPAQAVELVEGGQPHYDFIVSVE